MNLCMHCNSSWEGPADLCPNCWSTKITQVPEYDDLEELSSSLASEIPLARLPDEFGFPKTTFEMETVDFEEAKRLLREFRDITSNRKSWLELQALLGRLP